MTTAPVRRRAKRSRSRGDHLAPRDEAPLEPEDLLQLGVVRLLDHAVLELVDAVVQLGELGEEAVGERVDHTVQRERAAPRRLPPFARLPAQVLERRAVVAVHRDEVVLGEEAVHLHEPVAVGVGAEHHQVDEALELLDLGPLPEVLGVLDGEGVMAEGLAQQRELVGPRPVQVEPEELPALEVRRDDVAIDARVRAARVDQEALALARHQYLRCPAGAARAARRRSALLSRRGGRFLGPPRAPGLFDARNPFVYTPLRHQEGACEHPTLRP